MVYNDEVR